MIAPDYTCHFLANKCSIVILQIANSFSTHIKVVLDPLELFGRVNRVSSDLNISFHIYIWKNKERKRLCLLFVVQILTDGGVGFTCSIDFSALSINSKNLVDLDRKEKKNKMRKESLVVCQCLLMSFCACCSFVNELGICGNILGCIDMFQ